MAPIPLLLLACRPPAAPESSPDPRFEALAAWTEESIAQWQVPGVGLALLVDGEVHAGGVGVRLSGTDLPVTGDTVFRIASISKMLTGMAVLREVEAGRLDLAAPLDLVLDGVALEPPADLGTLRLHELLSHQGGLQVPGMPGACDMGPEALEEVVAEEAPTWQLWSAPGRFYNYSNNDYVLAGLAAQRSGGVAFTELVRQQVLAPAGAEGITYDIEVATARGHAIGHTMDREAGVPLALHDLDERACAAAHPSSGGLASARDLAAVGQLLLRGGAPVLTPASFDLLTGPAWSFSDTSWYGYGVQSFSYRGHRSLVHTGTMAGYNAVLWVLPDEQLGVIALVNADHPTTRYPQPWARPMYRIAMHALDELLGLEPFVYTSTVRPADEWDRFVGQYHSDFDLGTVTVARRGDALYMDSTDTEDGEMVQLRAYSADTFQLPHVGSDGLTYWRAMRFEEGADGAVEWLISTRGIARRVDPGQ